MERGLNIPAGGVSLTFRGASLPAGVDRREYRNDGRHNGAVARPIVAQMRSGYRCLPQFLPSQIANRITVPAGILGALLVGALGAGQPQGAGKSSR
jgi:hypothetical protein